MMMSSDDPARIPERFRLRGVQILTVLHERPASASAPVLEVEFKGLKCIGQSLRQKKGQYGGADLVQLVEECKPLSELNHPNIVQFLGIYYPEHEEAMMQAPIIVMEFLPTNLTSCIDDYRKICGIPPEEHGTLPKDISYSILHDVSLGLRYLHEHTANNVHGGLYSGNILLTPNMMAKISDLNKTNILSIGCTKSERTTDSEFDCKYHFLPQEMKKAGAKGTIYSDVFSYGIIMIHLLSGQLPEPETPAVKVEWGSYEFTDTAANTTVLLAISEADQREKFLNDIGKSHPLMNLIYECISDDYRDRPLASKIVDQLAIMVKQFPRPSFATHLKMLRQLDCYTCESKGGCSG